MFADDVEVYDALIDWPRRLASEEPLYRELFERHAVERVLDVACGTGRHVAMFHAWGLQVEGADLSAAMIARCRQRYGESETWHWAVRAFDQPHPAPESFDAVVCVGHSLALAPDQPTVERAMGAMLGALCAGGVCVLQVLNLWHLPDGPCVWQKCKRVTLQGEEHLLVKGVHRAGDHGFVDLVDLALTPAAVVPRYDTAAFLGLEADRLSQIARRSGAVEAGCFGGFQRQSYRREESPDLILVARK